ncbi:uncharacterized protein BKCO1_1700029 [Diplodia corticola]|uniref:Uncharacterized protein n=1 Tax=Diplodia corticola TaxID=236234 RepID=A0A1J9RS37_9PEZI|nr:uncharacterized protein BKCO1_1700029 [Diplodia corticola]OJD35363.1 hypothetical protein BKCO1_1700029 [Diplodia corticola]
MQQDVETASDGASSDSSLSDYMEVSTPSPTPPKYPDAPDDTCVPATANNETDQADETYQTNQTDEIDQTDHGGVPEAIIHNETKKPPVPAWMTDPAGRVEITVVPSVDKPHTEVTVGVHYCTLTHVELVGLMHMKQLDLDSHEYRKEAARLAEQRRFQIQPFHPAVARRQQLPGCDHLLQSQPASLPLDPVRDALIANDSDIQNAQGIPQRNGNGDVDVNASTQNKQPAPTNDAANTAQTTQAPQSSQRSDTVYVVLIQYQPMVEYGGSQFEFAVQDQRPKTDGFSTVEHYTKAFRLQADAKNYALHLFTQRVTLDYRYIMQKAWDDLSLEEIRAYGVTEDGPSPHIRGFRMSSIADPHYWQVRFGCDEEFCRISVIPVKSSDSKLQNMPFVEAGQPHGCVPTSLEPPKRPSKTRVDAEMADGAEGTTSTEATSNLEQSIPADNVVSMGTVPSGTIPMETVSMETGPTEPPLLNKG